MRRSLLVLSSCAVLLAGCGTACGDLADRICDCQPLGTQRDTCKAQVKAQQGQQAPSGTDQKFCEATLKTCPDPTNDPSVCDALNTPAGKAACGLAFPQ